MASEHVTKLQLGAVGLDLFDMDNRTRDGMAATFNCLHPNRTHNIIKQGHS